MLQRGRKIEYGSLAYLLHFEDRSRQLAVHEKRELSRRENVCLESGKERLMELV